MSGQKVNYKSWCLFIFKWILVWNFCYVFLVKAVLGSGKYAISSSNGFYVDTTSPVPDDHALLYIDVDQGDYTPGQYQGDNTPRQYQGYNSTIKGIWLCNDDESEIKVISNWIFE